MEKMLLRQGLIMIFLMLFQACANHTSTLNYLSVLPDFPMRFYQGPLNHLAAVRRGQCPMHPTCSKYCSQALARHGLILGWIMTTDRLVRCGRDEMKSALRVWVDGNWKFYDPVEYNDFWWYGSVDSDIYWKNSD